jgi:hypothetical protein
MRSTFSCALAAPARKVVERQRAETVRRPRQVILVEEVM